MIRIVDLSADIRDMAKQMPVRVLRDGIAKPGAKTLINASQVFKITVAYVNAPNDCKSAAIKNIALQLFKCRAQRGQRKFISRYFRNSFVSYPPRGLFHFGKSRVVQREVPVLALTHLRPA